MTDGFVDKSKLIALKVVSLFATLLAFLASFLSSLLISSFLFACIRFSILGISLSLLFRKDFCKNLLEIVVVVNFLKHFFLAVNVGNYELSRVNLDILNWEFATLEFFFVL